MTTPKQVKLGPEDRYRIDRLTEEVQGRLDELARIAARVSGNQFESNAVPRFVPAIPDTTMEIPPYHTVDIVCNGGCACFVYLDNGGVVYENPCGLAGDIKGNQEVGPARQTPYQRQPLEPEDSARVHRLTEEIQGRLEEASQIAARVHGMALTNKAVRKFVPVESSGPQIPHPSHVELFELPDGSTMCLITVDGGTIAEFPCGAAG